jgi:glycosyltransferase involved in cell wall biosynthesis
MIRVLHVQETIGSGGVERLRLSLARLLNKSTFELRIICTETIGDVADSIRDNGVQVIEIGKFRSVVHYKQHKKVQQIISEFKPHIIHGAVFEGVTMAAINGFICRVPVIILEETSDPKNRSWRGNLLMRLLCLAADKVIAVSPGVSEYLLTTLRLPENQVQLINNGVAPPRTVTQLEIRNLRSSLGIREGDIVIGSIGRMVHDEHKRFSDLIRAIPLLLQNNFQVKLLLVGDGPQLPFYKDLAIKMGIEDKVIFCGYQSDVAKFYSIMDIFSLVSAYEAFGLVLAEAMLHKLPVVATRVGGIKYIVEDKKTGLLVDRFNLQQIANSLALLCEDKQFRHTLGLNGFQKAINEYTEAKYVQEIAKMYNKMLE